MTDLEAEYMTSSLDGSHHPALLAQRGHGIIYDQKTKRFAFDNTIDGPNLRYDEIYRPCFQARDELLVTINKYQKKLKQPLPAMDARHDWKEVDECVQDACDGLQKLAEQDKDQSGALGRVKRAFRSLCRHAGAGQTFASLIPNDSFLLSSVLCGGMKAIFAGLRQSGLYREEVYRTLEMLPYYIEDHAANLKIYNQDEELHHRAAAVYVAVFKTQNQILFWFLKNTFVTGVRLLVDPTGYTDKLRECLTEVQITAQHFERQATKISRRVQDESMQLQYWATLCQDTMQKQLQTILERQEILNERHPRLEALGNLHSFLGDMMATIQDKGLLDNRNKIPTTKMLTETDINAILERFKYDPDMLPNDCIDILRPRQSKAPADQLFALHSNVRLAAWLSIDESSLLLLNGHVSPRPNSAISTFSARLISHMIEQWESRTLEEDGDDDDDAETAADVIPLAFFCGQHQDMQTDPNSCAEELAMSLFLQLMHRVGDRVSSKALKKCLRTNPEDIESICTSMGLLLQGLKRNVIVIVIVDGLRFFSRPRDRSEATRSVVGHLVDVFRKGQKATLKLMFTSPTRSDFVEDLFEEAEILNMPRDAPSRASPAMLRRSAGAIE